MLRPLLAFGTLCLVAFLLTPTVQSVHEGVEGLGIKREISWHIWKWNQIVTPPPLSFPHCDDRKLKLDPEVESWPARIAKNDSFVVGGHVRAPQQENAGVPGVPVDIFLNESKDKPGDLLGATATASDGSFSLNRSVPYQTTADHYHIVVHARETRIGCKVYQDAWSDPEMDVTARTTLAFDVPDRALIGRTVSVRGTLLDNVDAPVRNAAINLTVGGQTARVVTDGSGVFVYSWKPAQGGNVTLHASFAGTPYYAPSSTDAHVTVVPEDVQLDDVGGGIVLTRGTPRDLTGRVLLSPGATPGPLVFSFAPPGIVPNVTVTPDAGGNFTLRLLAPSTAPSGAFAMTASGGGLKSAFPFRGSVVVPVTLSFDAHGKGLLKKAYGGAVRAVDDNGRPVAATVAVDGPGGWAGGPLDASGVFAFSGAAPCGVHHARAYLNATGDYAPAYAEREFGVCGFLAFAPPWLLGTPLWAWPLAAVGALVLLALARRLFERYAPSFTRGPPLVLRFVEPSDGAPDVVGVGDRALASVTLDAPLPEGHALRVGTHRDMRVVAPDGREARVEIEAKDLGDLPVRAEIVNAKGRVVTRRTRVLHVVRYAEEIEARYRKIAGASLGERAGLVTPREFEAWLRERAPGVDPGVARNLVGLFEEADYSARDAGRPEFLAFLRAEKGVRG